MDTIGESQKKVVSSKIERLQIRCRFVTDKVQGNLEKEKRGRARETMRHKKYWKYIHSFYFKVE